MKVKNWIFSPQFNTQNRSFPPKVENSTCRQIFSSKGLLDTIECTTLSSKFFGAYGAQSDFVGCLIEKMLRNIFFSMKPHKIRMGAAGAEKFRAQSRGSILNCI